MSTLSFQDLFMRTVEFYSSDDRSLTFRVLLPSSILSTRDTVLKYNNSREVRLLGYRGVLRKVPLDGWVHVGRTDFETVIVLLHVRNVLCQTEKGLGIRGSAVRVPLSRCRVGVSDSVATGIRKTRVIYNSFTKVSQEL